MLTQLTHSELRESDSSVDRLNNNGAYARDNLAIISTKANTAKGKKSFEDVLALARGDRDEDGLSRQEWLRLACIMYGPSVLEDRKRDMLLPLATRIPNHCARLEWFQLQYCIVLASRAKASQRNKELKKLQQIASNDKARDLIDSVFSKMEMRRREVSYLYDAMVDSRIQDGLQKWFLGLDKLARTKLKVHLVASAGGTPFTREKLRRFSLETKGYVA